MLPSCSKEPEEGTIEDVVIDQAEPEEDVDSIFTKIESPYDYEYTTFTLKKAHMRFDVPKTWTVTVNNSRYVTIQTPKNDGYIPDTTISILCNYGEDVEENEMSEYTLNNHAYAFSAFFQNELEGLPTYTGGLQRHLRRYETEDQIRNGLEFVDKDHVTDAATLIVDDVVLMDKTGDYYSHECGMVSTYVKWDHSPFCFTSIADLEHMDNARNMLEYMVSSISYAKSDPVGYKTVDYKKEFTTAVPNTFVPVEGAENVFRSPIFDNTETAGMSVGVYLLGSLEENPFEVDDINEYYGQTVASTAFSGYSSRTAFGIQAEECDEEDGPDYTGSVVVDCTNYTEATEIAGSPFGIYANYMCDYYLVDKDGTSFLVAVMYQDCQKNLARAAGKTAVRKLKVD